MGRCDGRTRIFEGKTEAERVRASKGGNSLAQQMEGGWTAVAADQVAAFLAAVARVVVDASTAVTVPLSFLLAGFLAGRGSYQGLDLLRRWKKRTRASTDRYPDRDERETRCHFQLGGTSDAFEKDSCKKKRGQPTGIRPPDVFR